MNVPYTTNQTSDKLLTDLLYMAVLLLNHSLSHAYNRTKYETMTAKSWELLHFNSLTRKYALCWCSNSTETKRCSSTADNTYLSSYTPSPHTIKDDKWGIAEFILIHILDKHEIVRECRTEMERNVTSAIYYPWLQPPRQCKSMVKFGRYLNKKLITRWDSERELFTTTSYTHYKITTFTVQ